MDGDELAGIVDLFGGLTRSELEDALDELAFKRGDERADEQSEAANGRAGSVRPSEARPQNDERGPKDAVSEATRERVDGGEDSNENDVDTALREYYLVAVEQEDRTLLAPGPVAFPELPEYGADLPHILDVERRDVDREELAAAVRERLESESGEADGDRAEYLLDVTYDAEAWAPLELDDVRERLDVDS